VEPYVVLEVTKSYEDLILSFTKIVFFILLASAG
jgi:hypothetical protein